MIAAISVPQEDRPGPSPVGAMMDWIQLLGTPAVTTALSALTALGGVALGARLTSRRERWTAKRDAYAAVVSGFQQTRLAYRRMELWFRSRLPTSNAEALRRDMEQQFAPEIRAARELLYGAVAVARLILNAGAVAVLDQYEKEDAEAAEREGLFEGLAARRQAMEQAMDKIIVVARADLKIRGLTAAGEQNNP